ncbi:MAG: AAA domain-containing protein [Acidimicrobiales bacterium]
MKATDRATANRILLALADLAPSADERPSKLAVPTEWFRWLPISAVRLFLPAVALTDSQFFQMAGSDAGGRRVGLDRKFGERLAAVDRIRPARRSLRAGWLFVAGRLPMGDGRSRRVFHPLVTVPVRVDRLGGTSLVPAGDVEVSPLIGDWAKRRELDDGVELGGGALDGLSDVAVPAWLLGRLPRLQEFARAAAMAAELPAHRLVAADQGPDELCRRDGLVIVAGAGVYATYETGGASRAGSLRTWAAGPLTATTAFHRLYLDEAQPPATAGAQPAAVDSPFLLTPVQRLAVQRSRSDPVTLISGAPGTGKSHTLAAIACDALAHSETVLVAAKSDATVDALLDLLERSPGPDPVVFGSNERREALAARLSAGQLQPESEDTIEASAATLARAVAERDGLWAEVAELLGAEALLASPEDEFDEGRAKAPGLFDPAVDVGEADRLLDGAIAHATWWWGRRRRAKAERRLRRLAGAAPGVSVSDLARLVAAARTAKVVAALSAAGGLDIGETWRQLRAADDQARAALGWWLAAECRSGRHLNRSTLGAVAALATALRSGRSARREQLRRLSDEKLTTALPLWVGTLADVDDLLPAVPALTW